MTSPPIITKPSFDRVFSVLQTFYSDRCHSTKQPECDLTLTPDLPFSEIAKLDDGFAVLFFCSHFGITVPILEQWQSIVTVADFCRYVVDSIQLPAIQSSIFFDKQCDSAGLFLAIKKQLVERGESENDIGPSTCLLPYVKRHHDYFTMLRWIHLESMPTPFRWHIMTCFGCLTYITYLSGFAIGLYMRRLEPMTELFLICLTLISPLIFLMFLAINERIFRHRFLYVRFGELTDFRSLVAIILSRPKQAIA